MERRKLRIQRPAQTEKPAETKPAKKAAETRQFIVEFPHERNHEKNMLAAEASGCDQRHKCFVQQTTGRRFFAKQQQQQNGQMPWTEARVLEHLIAGNARNYVPQDYVLGRFTEKGAPTLLVAEVPGHELTFEDVCDHRVVLAALEALKAVNRAGVRHLDIKPQHFFVETREDGSVFVRLIDFGLALIVDPLSSEARETLKSWAFRGNLYASLCQLFGDLTNPLCDFQAFCFMLASVSHEAQFPRIGDTEDALIENAGVKVGLLQEPASEQKPWLKKARELVGRSSGLCTTDATIVQLAEVVRAGLSESSVASPLPRDAQRDHKSSSEKELKVAPRKKTPAPAEASPTPSPATAAEEPSAPSPAAATAEASPAPSPAAPTSASIEGQLTPLQVAPFRKAASLSAEDHMRKRLVDILGASVSEGTLPTFAGDATTQVDIFCKMDITPKFADFVGKYQVLKRHGRLDFQSCRFIGEAVFLPSLSDESMRPGFEFAFHESQLYNKFAQVDWKIALFLQQCNHGKEIGPLQFALDFASFPAIVCGVFACTKKTGEPAVEQAPSLFTEHFGEFPFIFVLALAGRFVFHNVVLEEMSGDRSKSYKAAIQQAAKAMQEVQKLRAQLDQKDDDIRQKDADIRQKDADIRQKDADIRQKDEDKRRLEIALAELINKLH